MALICLLLIFGNSIKVFGVDSAFDCQKWKKARNWSSYDYRNCLKARDIIIDHCQDQKYIESFQDCIDREEADWLRRHPPANYHWTCDEVESLAADERKKCERVEREFWSWAGRPLNVEALTNKEDAWFFPRYLLVCRSRKEFVEEFNSIQNNGGYYYPDKVGEGCWSLDGSRVGRISRTFPDSGLILIQYKDNMYQNVREVWTDKRLIMTMAEHQRGLTE